MLPLSLVILSHNRLDDLSQNINLLLSELSSDIEIEIIVVDNNSTDGSKNFLLELVRDYPNIKLVLNETNTGVAGGRNSGFAMATREYIVALDDDASISKYSLLQIPTLFEEYKTAGILAFKVIHAVSGIVQNPHGNIPCEIANHHGAGFAFRKVIYEASGGIDVNCDFGAEELGFCIKARVLGWNVLFIPEVVVLHNNYKREQNIDKFRRSRRVYNNIRIYAKYFPTWMAVRNSIRLFLLYLRTWLMHYGVFSATELFKSAVDGFVDGFSKREIVPPEIVKIYNNKKLRPEFGNVPIFDKIAVRIKSGIFNKIGKLR